MANQANNAAQREPSMEEILASIRRIIEDNETPKREPEFEPVESAIGPAANDPARSDIFGKAWQADMTPAAQPVVAEPDITASREPAIDESAFDMSAFSAAIEEEGQRAADPQWDVAALRSLDERAVAQAPRPAPEVRQAPTASAVARAATDTKSAIISEQAGRQVAASFGELSDAFAASRRRSFDDIAAEMIRPMLQDWLDNNLPVLVERLVREEIERVARGA